MSDQRPETSASKKPRAGKNNATDPALDEADAKYAGAPGDRPPNDQPPNDQPMTIIEHLTELRRRIIYGVLAFIIGFMALFPFAGEILDILLEPVSEVLIARGEPPVLISTKAQEYFFAIIRVSMLGGFFVGFPVIAYQLWSFVAPGLYARERLAVAPFMLAAPIMFTLGALFAHFIVSPLAMNFFIGFSDIMPRIGELATGGVENINREELKYSFQGKIEDVLDINLKLVFAFGICFQLPVALSLLGKVGLVSSKGLVSARRYAIVGIMTLAALVTPPDVLTQIILFGVVYGLYEASVWLVRWLEPKFEDELEEKHDEAGAGAPGKG